VRVHACVFVCVYVGVHVCLHACVCACARVVYTYVCVRVSKTIILSTYDAAGRLRVCMCFRLCLRLCVRACVRAFVLLSVYFGIH